METQKTQIAVISLKVENIEKGVASIQNTLKLEYVSVDKHALLEARVKRLEQILYPVLSVFGVAIVGAIAAFLIRGGFR